MDRDGTTATGPAIESLGKLAAAIGARGFDTHTITPAGNLPYLKVRNTGLASMMSESVTSDGEFFWWSWGDPVGPAADVAEAADAVARVLAITGEPPSA
jgi:hypothetical protein